MCRQRADADLPLSSLIISTSAVPTTQKPSGNATQDGPNLTRGVTTLNLDYDKRKRAYLTCRQVQNCNADLQVPTGRETEVAAVELAPEPSPNGKDRWLDTPHQPEYLKGGCALGMQS
jgi:hypothetical protein